MRSQCRSSNSTDRLHYRSGQGKESLIKSQEGSAHPEGQPCSFSSETTRLEIKSQRDQDKIAQQWVHIEDLEIEPLDEWTIGKMQYYAGIKK